VFLTTTDMHSLGLVLFQPTSHMKTCIVYIGVMYALLMIVLCVSPFFHNSVGISVQYQPDTCTWRPQSFFHRRVGGWGGLVGVGPNKLLLWALGIWKRRCYIFIHLLCSPSKIIRWFGCHLTLFQSLCISVLILCGKTIAILECEFDLISFFL
jgi:hypothetical protein